MKTTRIESGSYTIAVGDVNFQATALDVVYDDGSHKPGDGWRLLIQDDDEISGWEWCNDFATLWECKEAAEKSAADRVADRG